MANRRLYTKGKERQEAYQSHKEAENARSRAYHAANRAGLIDAMSERRYLRCYGITRAQKAEMLARQGNCCAACGSDTPGGRWGWNVDHIHGTKIIRGILCHHCNLTLGNAKEDVRRLRLLALYLEKHNA